MRIPLDLARTLAAVVDAGTLEAAARMLHLTPSAISQRVRALEDRVGRVVLVRTKPVRVTEAGEAIERLARQLDLLEHDALTALDAAEGTPRVPLAVNADSLATWFLPPLARVARTHGVTFELHRDDQDFTAGLLESGTVMAAVTSRAQPVAGCSVSALGILRYSPVAQRGFAARWFPRGVDAESLARAPLVDFDRRDDLQTQWLTRRGVDAASPPRHFVPASADFAAAIALGLGWGLLPTVQSEGLREAGELVALGDDAIDVPLYWQQWNLTSPLLDAVAAEVIAAATDSLASVPLSRR